MSTKPNKADPNYVSQRVLQTKKEIEQLKLELEKLINRGIESDKPIANINVSEDTNECEPQETKNSHNVPLHANAYQTVNVTKRPSSSFIPQKIYKKEEKNEVSPRKVRHYDVEEAREYIRKQKEKRLENMKLQIKESKNVLDTRKEKLKELQKKSLELVQKNISLKRGRSCSRERKHVLENSVQPQEDKKAIVPPNDSINPQRKPILTKKNPERSVTNTVPDIIINNVKEVPLVCSKADQNLKTGLQSSNQSSELMKNGNQSVVYVELHHQAATKIQSCYRGYRQRKSYQKIIKNKKKKLNKPPDRIELLISNNLKESGQEVLNKSERVSVPFWLQTPVQPYPYNFISAVKRKLNFATNTPIRTNSDVGIQISIAEPEKTTKTREEIKKAIGDSIKEKHLEVGPYTSHNCLDLNLKNIEILHLNDGKFDDLRNNCDIKKHSDHLLLTQTHSNVQPANLLEIDTSESDTSKNIPDISSESSVSTLHSKNCKSDISDYKLNINLEKFKNLKLRRRKHQILEDTIHILTDKSHKDSRISLNEVPQISVYKEDLTHTKLPDDNQRNLSNSLHRKLKSVSHASIIGKKPTERNEKVRSDSIPDVLYQNISKSENNVLTSSNSNMTSHQIGEREYHVPTTSDLIDLKSVNLVSRRNSKSEGNIPKFLEQNKSKRESRSETESNDDLKSFLEYMTSVEDSRKSKSQRKSSSTRISNSFKTLPNKSENVSKSVGDVADVEKGNSTRENYSSNFSSSNTSRTSSSVPSLKRPSVTLTTSENMELPDNQQSRNSISIKPGEIKCIETKTNTNQIHLKFEAELHLLNDFNESLRQFMAVEKSLLELHGKSQHNITVYQNQDTQTSAPLPSPTPKQSNDSIATKVVKSQSSQKTVPTINYLRGSDATQELYTENKGAVDAGLNATFQEDIRSVDMLEGFQNDNSSCITRNDKSVLTGLELSQQLNDSVNSTIDVSMSNISLPVNDISFNNNVYAGFSVGMFDQLIRDEDARIENLKTILKIREKALLDRTKGELAWLEIQKKQLIETGQLHEASLLKKKQRGIIIKLQHEKQEMQKLKQIQKAASRERKTILKEQRNMIKAQLSNNSAVPKIRRSYHKEKRHLGPVKVYNLHRETINTETSISRRSSVAEEIFITSRSESIVGQISEEAGGDQENNAILNTSLKSILNKRTEEAKKSLLMREAALQKRKKAAQDLLQWHQRLLEEERKIAELEMAANTIIKEVPAHVGDSFCKAGDEKYDFKGSQLNFLWANMTGRNEKKFKDEEIYSLNQIALEKLCTDAKTNLSKEKHLVGKPDEDSATSNSSGRVLAVEKNSDYSSKSSSHQTSKSDTIGSSKSSNESIIETERKKSDSTVEKYIKSQDNTHSYSSEFDSPEIIEEDIEQDNESHENKSHTEALVNELDRSKSTLNEIMQNISNITDEISAIYKLSSVANTIKDESPVPTTKTSAVDNTGSENKLTSDEVIIEGGVNILEADESKDDTLKSSAQSEIVKSLTELIISQNACQDIKSEQKHDIIETPESVCSKNTSTDSQGTLASNIELCTNSNRLEGETNKVTDDEESEVSLHTDINKELSQRGDLEASSEQEDTGSSKSGEGISVNYKSGEIINDYQKENHSVASEMCSINENVNAVENNLTHIEDAQIQSSESVSKSEVQNILDLSYGFTGVRTKQSETVSSVSESTTKSARDKTNTPPECLTEKADDDDNNSTNRIHNISDNIVQNEKQIESVLNNSTSVKLEDVNSINNEDVGNFNKSVEETTISTETDFEKSDLNHKNEDEEIENSISGSVREEGDILIVSKLSSPVVNSDAINNNENLINQVIIDNNANSTNNEILSTKSVSDDIDEAIESPIINDDIIDTDHENSVGDISIKSSGSVIDETNSKANTEELVLSLEKINDTEENKNESHKVDISTNDAVDNVVDVKKRISEILADTTSPREDKSPRLQDIYTTTYDIISPDHSPEIGSPASNDRDIAAVTQLYDEEAEALFKKQLAIEQEIKQLEQQQKEHIPYIYMREIPNKPPPPYTPPSSQLHNTNVLPASLEQLQSLTSNISQRLFKAHENANLETLAPNAAEQTKFLTKIGADRDSYEFVFDLCKEFAVKHYKQFVVETGPSWMVVNKKKLAKRKPFNVDELGEYLYKNVKEILEFDKVVFKEKMITKWSRKKRDHVDELLVIESQAEESEWTNYDDDEVLVKNELTNDIMNMLLSETANVIGKIFSKKMKL